MQSHHFNVGASYTRENVADAIDLPQEKRHGGFWATGYPRWQDETFVFCTIGDAARTGHDYPNRWEGKHLVWFGNSNSRRDHPKLDAMISGRTSVHVFWRRADRGAFTYAGLGRAINVDGAAPAQVTWAFVNGD